MVSVVIPIYNEEELVHILHSAVAEAMNSTGEDWEVVYVNDGSKDRSKEMLLDLQRQDRHIVVVDLSRNWGHMGAIHAGLKAASGDAIALMDGDMQDPPSVLPEMVEEWRKGAQVVTTVRRSRAESRKHLAFAFNLFYKVLGMVSDFPIPLNSGVFCLFDRKALDAVLNLREKSRYFPGLRAWVGYRTAVVLYDRNDRLAGEGKLNIMSRFKYAFDAICSFSYKPLRASFVMGALAIVASLLAIVGIFFSADVAKIILANVAAITFIGGLVLFAIGMLGEYIARIYDEVRDRPISLVNNVYRASSVARGATASERIETHIEIVRPAA